MQCFTIAINLCHATIRTIWVKTVSSGLILIEHFIIIIIFDVQKKSAYKIIEKHCKNYGFGNMSLLLEGQNGSKMSLFFTQKNVENQSKSMCFYEGRFFGGSPFLFVFFWKKTCFLENERFVSTGAPLFRNRASFSHSFLCLF